MIQALCQTPASVLPPLVLAWSLPSSPRTASSTTPPWTTTWPRRVTTRRSLAVWCTRRRPTACSRSTSCSAPSSLESASLSTVFSAWLRWKEKSFTNIEQQLFPFLFPEQSSFLKSYIFFNFLSLFLTSFLLLLFRMSTVVLYPFWICLRVAALVLGKKETKSSPEVPIWGWVARSKVKVWAAAGSEILNKSDQQTRQNQVRLNQLTSIWLDLTWCRKGENHTTE